MSAIDDIVAERKRQIEGEGWTALHDDSHIGGELAMAASCYAEAGASKRFLWRPLRWPWEDGWWRPTNQRRNLIKAAALIVAEIERLDRLMRTYHDIRTPYEQVLDEKDAKITRLSAELDDARYLIELPKVNGLDGVTEAVALALKVKSMAEEIARLREVLEPFAKAAEKCDDLDRRVQDSIQIPIDDLLRAYTALVPEPLSIGPLPACQADFSPCQHPNCACPR